MKSIKTITNEAILNDPAYISSVVLIAGSAAATVTLNDSDDGTGTDRIAMKVIANDSKQFNFEKSVKFNTAVYSTITGASAVAYIYYR